jgi:hypothetical protein
MKNKSNNNATRPETMAQKHARLYRESPLACFIATVAIDWKSGDMALSRMESVMYNLGFLTRVAGYDKFFGKMERIGRLGKGYGWQPGMGKITPNEIAAYYMRCIDFVEEKGWDTMTAQEIYDTLLANPKA